MAHFQFNNTAPLNVGSVAAVGVTETKRGRPCSRQAAAIAPTAKSTRVASAIYAIFCAISNHITIYVYVGTRSCSVFVWNMTWLRPWVSWVSITDASYLYNIFYCSPPFLMYNNIRPSFYCSWCFVYDKIIVSYSCNGWCKSSTVTFSV